MEPTLAQSESRKTTKLQNMRVIEIPPFRAVSSGMKTFPELFAEDGFSKWWTAHRHLIKDLVYSPPDFMWHQSKEDGMPDGSGLNTWILAVKDDVTASDVAPHEIIDFKGGMFLVATADEKDNDDINATVAGMLEWIKQSGVFEYGDFPKSGMCNMPNPEGAIDKALGIAQQQIFLPLKFRNTIPPSVPPAETPKTTSTN